MPQELLLFFVCVLNGQKGLFAWIEDVDEWLNAGTTLRRWSQYSDIQCFLQAILESPGVSRDDGKRPDGMTIILWSHGEFLLWDDVTVRDILCLLLASMNLQRDHGGDHCRLQKKRKDLNMIIIDVLEETIYLRPLVRSRWCSFIVIIVFWKDRCFTGCAVLL